MWQKTTESTGVYSTRSGVSAPFALRRNAVKIDIFDPTWQRMDMSDRAESLMILMNDLPLTRGRLLAVFEEVRVHHGLSEIESIVLNAVVHAAHPPTIPQIGRSLGHPRQVIHRTVDAMTERGLITSIDNPDHKRARRLLPTAMGRTLLLRAEHEGLEMAFKVTRWIDKADIDKAIDGLNAIRAGVEAYVRENTAKRSNGTRGDFQSSAEEEAGSAT